MVPKLPSTDRLRMGVMASCVLPPPFRIIAASAFGYKLRFLVGWT